MMAGQARGAAVLLCAALGLALGGCGGNLAAPDDFETPQVTGGREGQRANVDGTLFGGDDGLSVQGLLDGTDLGDETGGDGGFPVNRYLWQGSLETLSFLPLDSTDPFSGVIATEWATTPADPNQRFKVTVYVTKPVLEASALRVAVFREARNETGVWVPTAVSGETVTRLEDAILTRARQIRIAEVEGSETG